MRICEPFGRNEQGYGCIMLSNLALGGHVRQRSAAHSAEIRRTKGIPFYGHRKEIFKTITLALGGRVRALLLLHSMPEVTAEHYRNKIAVYLQ